MSTTTTDTAATPNAAGTTSEKPAETSSGATDTAAQAAAAAASGAPAGDGGTPAAAAADGKPNDGKPAGDATPAPGAPATYDLPVPEGGYLDQSDVDAFALVARTKNLTNDQARAALAEQAAFLKTQAERFLADTTAHPEVGGAKLEAAQIAANKALDKFLPPTSPEGAQLRSVLKKTGYGSHPALVVLLSRIGKAMSEDTPIGVDGTRGAEPRDPVSVLYGANA